ncbi:oligosaccharide flippase family protein [Marivivens sp. LCG002]|uniref:lipopolysaccharide biosynthesis protein n=1 Tax=Marivivens sp. LCG002 TaxID=3051171 RepID=UPI002552BA75|nr:oligosaccharide flippase family protein [Marivivens sp. LCG002]WIV51417.1 oligosaccharide flippase family protein [Marivivens sp. LCG002]
MKSYLRGILDRVRRPGFLRDILAVSSGSMGSQLIAILSSPILLRIYSPHDLGVQAVCISLLFVSVVASLKYNQAIPLPAEDNDAIVIAQLSVVVVLAMTIGIGLIFYVIGGKIVGATNTPSVIEYLWILPLIFLLLGISEVFLSVCIRFEKFKAVGIAQISQSGAQVLYQTLAGLLAPTPMQLVLGILVGNLVAMIIYASSLRREVTSFTIIKDSFSLDRLWQAAKFHKKFPILSAPAQIINAASIQATPLLLAVFYSTNVVGWLALAQRLVGLPITVIGYGVSQVFFQHSAKLQNQKPWELLSLYQRTARSLLLICLVPFLLIAILAPMIFGWVFGPEWTEAGAYVRLLIPMFICQFAIAPLSYITAVISAQRLQLIWDIGRLVLIVGLTYTAAFLKLDASVCIALYGLAMSASYIWLFFATSSALKKLSDVHAE